MKKVQIVLPIHNRPEHTKQTLESLCNNTPHDLYDLFLIDDGSNQQTTKIIFDFWAKHHSLTATPYPNEIWNTRNEEAIGPAASRNNTCKYITENNLRGEYLYFSDNDVFFTEGWLEAILEVFPTIENKVKLLGGGCHPYLQNKDLAYASTASLSENRPVRMVYTKDAVSGYSQLMTWETWDKYGPLDEGSRGQEKKIAGSEDWAMSQRIIKDGFLVGSIEPEVVHHTGRTNTYNEPATGYETIGDWDGVIVK